MLIEALKPLTYRWPGGEVHLAPGQPVDLPEDRARKLLVRAAGKVRLAQIPLIGGTCLLCSQGTDTRREGIPLCPACADLPEASFLAPYRDILRRWWAGDALAVKERRTNPEWPALYQELTRLQDEIGFEKARALRMKWAEEWHRETGTCPHCGTPGPYHDPYGENAESW